MAKYRIVKLDTYDHVFYQVQKLTFGFWWRTMSIPISCDHDTSTFKNVVDAENWIASKGFVNKTTVVKEITVKD